MAADMSIPSSLAAVLASDAWFASCDAPLRDALVSYQGGLPGARILSGSYGSNALAIGYAKDRPATADFVKGFTRSVTASGFVDDAIGKAGIRGAAAPGG